MTTILAKRYNIDKSIRDPKTDCQKGTRTIRREIERKARRQQPKQAHPKTTKGFATN